MNTGAKCVEQINNFLLSITKMRSFQKRDVKKTSLFLYTDCWIMIEKMKKSLYNMLNSPNVIEINKKEGMICEQS